MSNSSDLSRRNVWKPLAGGLVAAAAVAPLASAAAPDPIFAEIEAHRAAYARWIVAEEIEDQGGADARQVSDDEAAVWQRLLKTKPTTLAGLTAFAAYIVDNHAWCGLYEDEDTNPFQALPTIAAALRDMLAV